MSKMSIQAENKLTVNSKGMDNIMWSMPSMHNRLLMSTMMLGLLQSFSFIQLIADPD
jgi:hypothetical protein